ncbi:hypothetical protein BJX63DRAFT_381901 [Aspergillus granulosus]|uniref:Uncharacterized protein n=1 Tax=Aspergillus granulosus TaxID=176169 RepID=A0ABR4HXE1_9EURO
MGLIFGLGGGLVVLIIVCVCFCRCRGVTRTTPSSGRPRSSRSNVTIKVDGELPVPGRG